LEFPDRKPEKELTRLMLFDMEQTGLKFRDLEFSFNNPVSVFGEDGKPQTIYQSMWKAAL